MVWLVPPTEVLVHFRSSEEFMVTERSIHPRLHTVIQAGERLNICRSSVYKLLKSGALRSVKVCGRRLISEQAIVDFIAEVEMEGCAR